MSPHSSSQSSGTLYDVRWNEVCPPLILVRALRVSVLVRVLGLSLIGVLLTSWGWSWFDQLFSSGAAHLTPLTELLSYSRVEELHGNVGSVQQSDTLDTGLPKSSSGGTQKSPHGLVGVRPGKTPKSPATAAPWAEKKLSGDGSSKQRKVNNLSTEKNHPANQQVTIPHTARWVDRATHWVSWQGDSWQGISWRNPLTCAWSWLSEPLVRSARLASGWRQSLVLILSGIWAIVVWALFGGAISRIAALYLTRGETLGPLVALREAFQKWAALIGAPLIPLIGSALLALPMVLAGLLLRSDFMALVIGLCWIVVILWGFMLAVILIGLLIGWPLMWATVGVERTDAFDGVSRCYAYVYQRPMHLMLYIGLAMVLGWLGQIGVEYFAMSAASLGEWAVSWGAGQETLATLLALVGTGGSGSDSTVAESMTGLVASGAAGIRFWKAALRLSVAAYAVAYLWSAAVGIYLLLRRQVDATEMDEVVIGEGAEEGLHGLPPLHADPSGVPGIGAVGGT